MNYVVATIRPWHLAAFERRIRYFPGTWRLISERERLTVKALEELGAVKVFVPHWSWKVDASIINQFECIAFHPTDLPYGRGGSPIQNLIARGHRETKLTAFRMTAGFDDGPVYMRRPLSLEGTAEEIFVRTAELTADMISEIVEISKPPQPQEGRPTIFERRTPQQSQLPPADALGVLFDHIRMLDAEGYPRSYLDFGRFRIEFKNPVLRTSSIETIATISERNCDD